MKLTITIDVPDGQVAEFARLVASHLADLGQPAAAAAFGRSGAPSGRSEEVGKNGGDGSFAAGQGPAAAGPKGPPPRPEGAPPRPEGAPPRAERAQEPPTDGRTLLGWADRHGLRDRVVRHGRVRKYPGKVVDWSAEQVADCYHEVRDKPVKGSQDWGGAAVSGQVRPK